MFQSLYAHFPFCESKCHYCDFYSIGRERTAQADPVIFEEALAREALLWKDRLPDSWDTVFFGGGTPSMTPPETVQKALVETGILSRVTSKTEWTMEANPSSVSTESLRQWNSIGVNRVSMGVQAMRDDLLLRLGRVHSREKALEALGQIFEAGISNVSVDLLCGVPGQNLKDIDDALDALTQFPITHLSCYLLTLPKSHKMHRELPPEETQLEHLTHLHDRMTDLGFEHYEISNYARPGFRARHNLNYWRGASYLGLGPSAHSYSASDSRRWKNVSSLHKYGRLLAEGSSPIEWEETLTAEQKDIEKWMLALRLEEGFPDTWISTPGQKHAVQTLQEKGLLEPHPTQNARFRLTPRGFCLSDPIVGMFLK